MLAGLVDKRRASFGLCAEYRPKRGLQCWAMSIPATNAHSEASSSASLLEASLSLARTQPVGQLADETRVDGLYDGPAWVQRSAVCGALAAKRALGAVWWIPVVVLAVAVLLPGSHAGPGCGSWAGTDLGPNAKALTEHMALSGPPRRLSGSCLTSTDVSVVGRPQGCSSDSCSCAKNRVACIHCRDISSCTALANTLSY